jgi:hypothetical protein
LCIRYNYCIFVWNLNKYNDMNTKTNEIRYSKEIIELFLIEKQQEKIRMNNLVEKYREALNQPKLNVSPEIRNLLLPNVNIEALSYLSHLRSKLPSYDPMLPAMIRSYKKNLDLSFRRK